jgi:hypothetical protein
MSHHQCAICWEECVENEEISIIETRCNHFFHKECLDIWTANHNTCPCCRTQLSQENIHENIHENIQNNHIDIYNINFLNNMIIEEYISNNQNYNNIFEYIENIIEYNNNNIIYDNNINIVNLINHLNNSNNIINNENIIDNFNNSENIVAINNIIHNN